MKYLSNKLLYFLLVLIFFIIFIVNIYINQISYTNNNLQSNSNINIFKKQDLNNNLNSAPKTNDIFKKFNPFPYDYDISTMYADKNLNIWIGTQLHGIYFYSQNYKKAYKLDFSQINHIPKLLSPIIAVQFLDISKIKHANSMDGANIFVATNIGLISIKFNLNFLEDTKSLRVYGNYNPVSYGAGLGINAISFDNPGVGISIQNLLIGTFTGLYKFNLNNYTFEIIPWFNSTSINDLLLDGDGHLWVTISMQSNKVSSQSSLVFSWKDSPDYGWYSVLNFKSENSQDQDLKGNKLLKYISKITNKKEIYISTFNQGLYYVDVPKETDVKKYYQDIEPKLINKSSNLSIESLNTTVSDYIWVTTSNNSNLEYNPYTDEWKNNELLSENVVNQILEINNQYFISTNQGIYIANLGYFISPPNNNVINPYDGIFHNSIDIYYFNGNNKNSLTYKLIINNKIITHQIIGAFFHLNINNNYSQNITFQFQILRNANKIIDKKYLFKNTYWDKNDDAVNNVKNFLQPISKTINNKNVFLKNDYSKTAYKLFYVLNNNQNSSINLKLLASKLNFFTNFAQSYYAKVIINNGEINLNKINYFKTSADINIKQEKANVAEIYQINLFDNFNNNYSFLLQIGGNKIDDNFNYKPWHNPTIHSNNTLLVLTTSIAALLLVLGLFLFLLFLAKKNKLWIFKLNNKKIRIKKQNKILELNSPTMQNILNKPKIKKLKKIEKNSHLKS